MHEEYNVGEEDVNFLQIWIQPKQQNIRPRYQWRHFPKAQRRNQLQTIVSFEEGLAHCWINQNAKLSLGFYEEESTINYSFNPANKCLFLFVIEGSVVINNTAVNKRDGIGIWDTSSIDVKLSARSEFLVIETPVNQK